MHKIWPARNEAGKVFSFPLNERAHRDIPTYFFNFFFFFSSLQLNRNKGGNNIKVTPTLKESYR